MPPNIQQNWIKRFLRAKENKFLADEVQATVVQKVDSAIHWIKHYSVNNTIVHAYPLVSDIFG